VVELLGVDFRTLLQKLKEHKLEERLAPAS
jgi:hypothetical protein